MDKITNIENKKGFISIPFDSAVYNLIPHTIKIGDGFAGGTNDNLLVPHGLTETKLLRNMGYQDISSPFLKYYDWNNTIPFEHQKTTSDMLVFSDRAYVLNDMGTGKTLSVLYAIDYLIKQSLMKKVLIIAPLSTLTSVWEREIFRWTPHLDAVVLHGSKKKRRNLLAKPHDIYIINHDGVETIFPELIARTDIDTIVVDELTAYKNAQTLRWKTLNKLAPGKRVWGLTGNPTPQAPTDAYGQVRLITPSNIDKSFKLFQSKTMLQVSQFTWVPKKEANTVIHTAMQPAVRFKMEDCISLPPITYNDARIPITPKQTLVYNDIMRKLHYQYQHHEVTAANEGVKLSKLLQVACGFVYLTNSKGAIQIDNNNRIDALCDIIDASRRKLIVFLPFRHGIKLLNNELLKRKYDVAVIHGGVNKTARDKIYNDFQNSPSPKIIIAHPRTMAHGLTLTEANVVVWYSPSQSLEMYLQANARVRRPGQQYKQYIVHIQGCPVEERIYKRLTNKQTIQGALLEMFEDNTSV